MSGSYSSTTVFDTAGTTPKCVELPASQRGDLDRVIITQLSGTAMSATFKIYDRRGACAGEPDIHVDNYGSIVSVTNSGGNTAITFDAAHGMQVGDRFEIKENNVTEYNVIHTVTSVTSDTAVVTDIGYTSAPSTMGVWQTEPFLPTTSPVGHLLYSGSITAGNDFTAFDLGRGYENRDNQLEVDRLRYNALWLEFTPGAGTAASWEISITVDALQLL